MCGGGVVVSSNGGYLKGGIIKDNRAGDQGGGVYLTTIPYTLHIENAYIADNSARIGGGIWLCPTGSGKFKAENGGLLYNNEADMAGDDFLNESGSEYYVSLPSRGPNCGNVTYYDDSDTDNRVRDGGSRTEYTKLSEINTYAALKTEMDENTAAESRKLSSLFIENNYAPKGGGLALNGAVNIGRIDAPLKDV